MSRNKYQYLSDAALRGFLRATAAWPICVAMRGQRLAVDAELTRRAIEEECADGESWPSLPVEGVQ